MSLKSIVLAAAALASLAAPAAALADPYWGHDRGDWRRHEWREHGRWEHARYGYGWGHGWGYGPRCWVERHGHYTWYGDYVVRTVRVCR